MASSGMPSRSAQRPSAKSNASCSSSTPYNDSCAGWPDQRADMSPPPGSRIASAIPNRFATASTRASSRTAPGASGCTVTGSPPAAHTLSTRLAAFTSARYRNTVAPSEKRAGMTTIGRDRRGALLGSSIVDPGGLEVGVLVHRMTGFVAPRPTDRRALLTVHEHPPRRLQCVGAVHPVAAGDGVRLPAGSIHTHAFL